MTDDELCLLFKRIDTMFNNSERLAQEKQWSEIADYMLPSVSHTMNSNVPTQDSAGEKRGRKTSCSEPIVIAETAANLFLGLITNPSTIWSQIKENTKSISSSSDVIEWLQEDNMDIHQQFDESNFYTEWAKFVKQYLIFGNAAIFQEELNDDSYQLKNFTGFNFTCLNIGQVAWQSNRKGYVDTLCWKFTKTAQQARDMWGAAVDPTVAATIVNNPDKKFEFYMFIDPRDKNLIKINKATGLALPTERPFRCLYLDPQSKTVLKEDGYYEFPVSIGRYELAPAEEYGRGRGHVSIYDVRSYNQIRKDEMYGVAMDYRPMILANQRDIFGTLPIKPGTVGIVRNIQGVRELVSQARTDRVTTLKQELLDSIKSTFYLDRLLLPPRQDIGQMREVEVQARIKEISTIFGAVGLRLDSETLSPLIIRSFKMMLRKGVFDPLPPSILNASLDVDISFINELSSSQQMSVVQNSQQWVSIIETLAQIKPESLDIVNADNIVKEAAAALNVSEMNIIPDAQVAATRQQRAQQQQQQAQMQQANLAADTASKAQNSGLTQQLQQMQPAGGQPGTPQ